MVVFNTTSLRPGEKIYRSRDGHNYFRFQFEWTGAYFNIFCHEHPSFNGQDDAVQKTHLYQSGKLCFVSGKEPRTQERAVELAAQWAEYFIGYLQTGQAKE